MERRGEHTSGVELDAVELYWADTTRLGAGRLDTILGLFRAIFESQPDLKPGDPSSWPRSMPGLYPGVAKEPSHAIPES